MLCSLYLGYDVWLAVVYRRRLFLRLFVSTLALRLPGKYLFFTHLVHNSVDGVRLGRTPTDVGNSTLFCGMVHLPLLLLDCNKPPQEGKNILFLFVFIYFLVYNFCSCLFLCCLCSERSLSLFERILERIAYPFSRLTSLYFESYPS